MTAFNNIFVIMKKEFIRFFSDKRLFFIAVLMPGVMVYLIYTILGSAMNDRDKIDSNYQYLIYGENVPNVISELVNSCNLDFQICYEDDTENLKNELTNKEIDLLMIFPENFDDEIEEYNVTSQMPAPDVKLFYNSSKTESYEVYNMIVNILNSYEESISNKFNVNKIYDDETRYDCSSEEDMYGQVLSLLMPMLLMVFMFSGCMQIAPESIAGEKERGTIATILITPVMRYQLAIGKVLALSCISLISGISSFIGIIASLPNIIETHSTNIAELLTIKDYCIMFAIMLSTVLVIVSVMSILSAYAKTVKEATAYLTPFMLIIIGISMSGNFINSSGNPNYLTYAIPMLNSSQCFMGIFSFDYSILPVILTFTSNIIFAAILSVILSKMFKSEQIIFSR